MLPFQLLLINLVQVVLIVSEYGGEDTQWIAVHVRFYPARYTLVQAR